MVLIEGLGDEVTLVLGSFLVMVVLLMAWFSTHTEDIPLIREIVVELRMRNRSRTVIDEQPQEEEIPPSVREGIPSNDSADQDNSMGNSLLVELLGEAVEGSEESASNSEGSASSSSSETSETPRPTEVLSSSSEQRGKGLTEPHSLPSQTVEVKSPHDQSSDVTQRTSLDDQEVGAEVGGGGGAASTTAEHEYRLGNSSVASVTSSPEGETKEETLRRRRVRYFQSGAHVLPPGDSLSWDNSNDDNGNSQNGKSDSHQDKSLLSEVDCDIPQETVTKSTVECSSPPPCTNQPQRPSSQNEQETNDPVTEGGANSSQIRVRLKYINDTQRFVYASPGDTIGDFRRTHFQSELQDNKWVRFIFNGQDLRDDASTLQACNIENNCTMHCLVTQRTRPVGERGAEGGAVGEEEEDSVLGSLMYPLFMLMLMVVWYFRIFYRQYFSAMSTVCLIGISFLLALSYLSSFRTSAEATRRATATAAPSTQASATAGARHNHPHSD